MDGAAVVNILKPVGCKTFGDYAEKIFTSYVKTEFVQACRIDVVWDRYEENSLKSQTRETRCTGATLRRKVEKCTPITSKWNEFLRVSENKTELFSLLSQEILNVVIAGKELVTTVGTGVCANFSRDTSGLAPCNHEEADTRIMVHLVDAVHRGYSKVKIRTVDTDVVVLAISTCSKLPDGTELWIAFGTGKDFRYIPIHSIAKALGPVKSLSLPVFHAFTGCDTVSHFANIGKKMAWKIWENHNELTAAFYDLHEAPTVISDETALALERFTVLLYDRNSEGTSVNEARKVLFTRKGRQMSSLPPTQASLKKHMRRAVLQGGFSWGLATVKYQDLPSPAEWGWECPEKWQPLWTDLPEAAVSCQELLKCKCRSRCFGCKCAQAELKCTVYCSCRGDCENS